MLSLSPLQREALELMGIEVWVSRDGHSATREIVGSVGEAGGSESSAQWSGTVVQQIGSPSTGSVLVLCECDAALLSDTKSPERRLLDNILHAAGFGATGESVASIALIAASTQPLVNGRPIGELIESMDQADLIAFGGALGGFLAQSGSRDLRISAPGLGDLLETSELKPGVWRQIQNWRGVNP